MRTMGQSRQIARSAYHRPRISLWVTLALCAVTTYGQSAHAQQVSIKLQTDRQLAKVGEPVVVSVEFSTQGQADAEYRDPVMTGWTQVSGGMTSQNIEVINWQVTRRESHVYTVVAPRPGSYVLGPAAVEVDGKIFRSNSATVEVRPSDDNPTSEPQAADASHESDMAAGLALPKLAAMPSVFIGLRAWPRRVYVGQQVAAEWKLYTQSDVVGFQMQQQPTTDGFWAEDLQVPQRLHFEREIIADRVYYGGLLLRKALFPQRVGQVTIGTLEAQVQTMATFGAATQRASEAVTIEVLPLPEKNRPSGFSPSNVGRFEIAARLDREMVKVGDAVALRVTLRGVGNVRQLQAPLVRELTGLKVYEPKIEDVLDSKADDARGEKRIEYLLLPTQGGTFTIPSLILHYFDPALERYAHAQTAPLTLTVSGSAQAVAEPQSNSAKANELAADIRPPRPPRHVESRQRPALVGVRELVLLLVPLLALVLVGFGGRVRQAWGRPTLRSRDRALERAVAQQQKAARMAMQARDTRKMHEALAAALHQQLSHLIETRSEGLTREGLAEALALHGVELELRSQIATELDRYDTARYAPGGVAEDLERMLEQAQQVMTKLAAVQRGDRRARRGARR